MAQLRPVSARPELVVGDDSARIEDAGQIQLGVRGAPIWRERVLYALPLNHGQGPVQLARLDSVQGDGALLADPSGNVIGQNQPVHVHRMLYARWTEDTRI